MFLFSCGKSQLAEKPGAHLPHPVWGAVEDQAGSVGWTDKAQAADEQGLDLLPMNKESGRQIHHPSSLQMGKLRLRESCHDRVRLVGVWE